MKNHGSVLHSFFVYPKDQRFSNYVFSCCVVLYCVLLCNVVIFCTMLCFAVLCCVILCDVVFSCPNPISDLKKRRIGQHPTGLGRRGDRDLDRERGSAIGQGLGMRGDRGLENDSTLVPGLGNPKCHQEVLVVTKMRVDDTGATRTTIICSGTESTSTFFRRFSCVMHTIKQRTEKRQ